MTDYKKCDTVMINGKKRTVYSKPGSTKRYVTHKGRKMNIVKYRKMLDNKAKVAVPAKPRKTVKRSTSVKKHTRHHKKRGGDEGEQGEQSEQYVNFDSALQSFMPIKMGV